MRSLEQGTFVRVPALSPHALLFGILVAGGAYALYISWDVVRIEGVGRLFVAANDNWSDSDELLPENQNENTWCESCTHYCGLVNISSGINYCECGSLNPLRHCRGCIQ